SDYHPHLHSFPTRRSSDLAAPVRTIHDLVARSVYQGVRVALESTISASAAQAVPRNAHPIDERLAGRLAVGVLNGAFGDLLERRSEEHTSELQSQSNLVCR